MVYYIVVILLILLSIALTWGITRYFYLRIIDVMTIKNRHLTERVKRAETVILHDLLQLSPDDIDLVKKQMEDDVNKSATKE